MSPQYAFLRVPLIRRVVLLAPRSNVAKLGIILSDRNWNSLQTALPRHPSSYRHLLQRTCPIDHFSIFELSYPVTYPGCRSSYSAFCLQSAAVGYLDRSHARRTRPFSRKLNPYRWSVERKSPSSLFRTFTSTESIARAHATDIAVVAVESRNEKHSKSTRSCSNAIRSEKDRKDLPKPLTEIKTSDTESLRCHC